MFELDPHLKQATRSAVEFAALITSVAKHIDDAPGPVFAEEDTRICGRPYSWSKGENSYLPPERGDRAALMHDLMLTLPHVTDKVDRANLVYLSLQLTHSLTDKNGRVGRFLHQAFLGNCTVDPRFLADSIRSCEFTKKGANFDNEVVSMPVASFEIARVGTFAQVFPPDFKELFVGVVSSDLDNLSDRELLATITDTCHRIARETARPRGMVLVDQLSRYMSGVGIVTSPLKVAASILARQNNTLLKQEPVDFPAGGLALDVTGIVDFINRLSIDHLCTLTQYCRELARNHVVHVHRCFDKPNDFVSYNGLLKDFFRGPKYR